MCGCSCRVTWSEPRRRVSQQEDVSPNPPRLTRLVPPSVTPRFYPARLASQAQSRLTLAVATGTIPRMDKTEQRRITLGSDNDDFARWLSDRNAQAARARWARDHSPEVRSESARKGWRTRRRKARQARKSG